MCTQESSESGPLISGEDVKIIFSNVETLIKVRKKKTKKKANNIQNKVNHELLTAFSLGIKEKIPTERKYEETNLNNYLVTCVAVFSIAIEKVQKKKKSK